MKSVCLLNEDFSDFSIGEFPYDPDHSAMGEYHFYPPKGYTGNWYDPIYSYTFRGPTWLITELDGEKYMEQQRVDAPVSRPTPNGNCPTLVAGEKDWTDYTATVNLQLLSTAEPCGLLFRYQTSLSNYGFFIGGGKAQIIRVDKYEREILAEAAFEASCDQLYELKVSVRGNAIDCFVDGEKLLSASDECYKVGCIALAAFMPARYKSAVVECGAETYAAMMKRRKTDEEQLALDRTKYFGMKLHKVINLKGFGAGRQIRFGHLTGTDEMFFVMAQNQKRVFKDRYGSISCLTAVSIETGEILWQLGTPVPGKQNAYLTADLPMQVYDIDGDGIDEVIIGHDFKLKILDGKTGQVKKWIHSPFNEEPADELCGIEFKKHAFDRLNIDAIMIMNLSGGERPSDIVIKDRYARLWAYDKDLNFKWKFSEFNTGHFPIGHDINGDGREEIISCYNLVSPDGKLIWKLPIETDHTDEIVVARLKPGDDEKILIVSGWEGFMILDKEGNILKRDINGHGQRISVANYCPEREGMEIACTTYWGNQGIVYLYDCDGNEIWRFESGCNGNIITPVNWQGDGSELMLMNANVKYGGLFDGDGRQVVKMPDDGHPDLCAEVLDICGDGRDEIVVWDEERMFIYTQDGELPQGAPEYRPRRNPHHNASNYRGEYSFK
jgi:rhamnogalacturonan endolyase